MARVAEMRLQLPAKKFPPAYDRYGSTEAPKVRNYQMAAEAAAHGRRTTLAGSLAESEDLAAMKPATYDEVRGKVMETLLGK